MDNKKLSTVVGKCFFLAVSLSCFKRKGLFQLGLKPVSVFHRTDRNGPRRVLKLQISGSPVENKFSDKNFLVRKNFVRRHFGEVEEQRRVTFPSGLETSSVVAQQNFSRLLDRQKRLRLGQRGPRELRRNAIRKGTNLNTHWRRETLKILRHEKSPNEENTA